MRKCIAHKITDFDSWYGISETIPTTENRTLRLSLKLSPKAIFLSSVFESLRSYNGKIFRLNEHLDRLKSSLKTSGAELSKTEILNIKKIIERRHKASRIKNAYIRIALSVPSGKMNLIIKEERVYPDAFYRKGVSLRTSSVVKSVANQPGPRVKSSNFLPGICAKIESGGACPPGTLRGRLVFEALMLNDRQYVAEATVSNIFIVKATRILTPIVSSGILGGITRGVVFDLAKALGIDVVQTNLTRHDLFNADECFLTNTTIGILPVVEIDGRKIGNGRPGELTKRLMKQFENKIGGVNG